MMTTDHQLTLAADGSAHGSRVVPGVVMVLESKFPTDGGGGAENQVRRLANFFSAQGARVRVVALHAMGETRPEHDTVDGFEVRRLRYPNVRLIGGLVLQLRLAWWLFSERGSYGAVHVHIAGNMAAVCCLMGRLLGKTSIIKFTGFTDVDAGGAGGAAAAVVRNAALRKATWVQATSNRIARAAVSRGFDAGSVRLIPNGIELARFRPRPELRADLRHSLSLPADATVAIYCGRIETVKGIHVLVDAWGGAFAGRRDVFLLVAGSASQSINAFTDDLSRRPFAAQVRYLGAREDVAALLPAADFAVLPSLAEGLSNSLLEFMACGLPVVGTRVSGTEDLIREGVTGTICEPGDVAGLSGALARMVALSPTERHEMGARARAAVTDHAGMEQVGTHLARLYGFANLAPMSAMISGGI